MKFIVYWSLSPENRVKASAIAREKLPELQNQSQSKLLELLKQNLQN